MVMLNLYEESLGLLEMGCDPYVVASLQIGSPGVREVKRDRALGDGAYDDTKYLSSRAITAAVRLKTNGINCEPSQSMQQLLDRVTPYMSPRVRPTLSWQLPGSSNIRAAVVRGHDWPYKMQAPKHLPIALQWVVPSGEILGGLDDGTIRTQCETIRPAQDTEDGRTYDLIFDREYPPSAPIGSRAIDNPGNAHAHWELTIYGPVELPRFTINGVEIRTDNLGSGLTILAGQHLTINTRSRTALFNSLPNDSRYFYLNYNEWSWDDLLLRPNQNMVRYDGDNVGVQSSAVLCWSPTFL